MKIIKSPDKLESSVYPTIFLGGSIEMGKAEDWQTRLITDLKDCECTIWNPRRDDWDASWEQDPTPGTKFFEQVDWELTAQEQADIIVYYFDPDTKAPITLLETGLFKDSMAIVCCPDGFWRKGNIVMVCNRFNIELTETYDNLLFSLKEKICYSRISKEGML